jgi:8-hydroxy-5-deazaflavin:NADPH oxidoreductase
MTVGIIGTGRMGRAMAAALAARGTPVLLASLRRPVPRGYLDGSADARTGGIRLVDTAELLRRATTVVLALPFPAAVGILGRGLGRVGAGRVLIDVTNPRLGPHPPAGAVTWASGGERVAELAPDWLVAKAFNTVSADAFDSCRLDGEPVCVPVATDHPVARDAVFALARRLGFEPLDAGGIRMSGELESLAVLLVGVGAANGLGSRVAIRIGVPQNGVLVGTGGRYRPESDQ